MGLARSVPLSPFGFYILTSIPVSHFGIGIDTARYAKATAKRLAAAKLDSILDIPYMYPELAKKLHNAAKSSTAHAIDEVQEELVKAKLKEIFAGKQQSLTLLKTKRGAWDSLPDGPHQRIHSIKGIGLQRRLRW